MTKVSYCWTEGGDPEECGVEAAVCSGEACYHCGQPIEGEAVRLSAPDGDEYLLHRKCAHEGCAAADRLTIDALLNG